MTNQEIVKRLIVIEGLILQLMDEVQGRKEEDTDQNKIVTVTTQKILKEIGIKEKWDGYDFLLEEIISKIKEPNVKLYMASTKKFSRDYYSVGCCIRMAKERALKNEEKSELTKMLFQGCNQIPTNKKFITVLANYVEELTSRNDAEEVKNTVKKYEDKKEQDEKEFRIIIKKFLGDFGIIPGTNGYEYLIEEIMAKMKQPDCKLYWNSVQIFSKSYSNVSSNIKLVKTKAFRKGESELLKKVFCGCHKIPPNKDFIAILVDYIKNNVTI